MDGLKNGKYLLIENSKFVVITKCEKLKAFADWSLGKRERGKKDQWVALIRDIESKNHTDLSIILF